MKSLNYEFFIDENKVTPDEFKKKIIEIKLAEIEYYRNNEKIICKRWNAKNFNESSNLMNNVRTRSKIERGEWRQLEITKIIYIVKS